MSPSPPGLEGHPSRRGPLAPWVPVPNQRYPLPGEVPHTIWGVCCSDVSSWILISGHAGSPDLPASGWGDRVRPGKGGRREPPHWPRGGTKETQAWMGGWYWGSPTLPNPSLRDPHLNSPPSYTLLSCETSPPALDHCPMLWSIGLVPALCARPSPARRSYPGTWRAAPARGAHTVVQPCAVEEGVPLMGSS